jgi:hypothetical protein
MLERRLAGYRFRIIICEELEHANAPYLVGLLCTRRNRPSRRAAQKRNKLPPSHFMILAQ